MDQLLQYAILAFIIFVTHFQEAITGFGCTVLALPFVVFLLGMKLAVKVLVIQAWILTGYIVFTSRKHVVWRQYGKIVLFAGAGLPVGIFVIGSLPESALKYVLGAFMVGVAIRGLVVLIRARKSAEKWSPSVFVKWLMNLVLFFGGVIHGAFGSGGPFVVMYATKALPDKNLFRVTLCTLWFTLNSIMVIRWTLTGALSPEVIHYTALCTPFTVLGMVIGDKYHHRMNEHAFRVMVYGVLLLSGIAVLYSAARAGA